jgi:ATP-dependent exoDNAse (exonuclease V) alpha subunit
LQAIGAGAPFRAITEEIGHAELSEIPAARGLAAEASVDFATHRTAEGLAAYRDHGNISFAETGEDARGQIVRDYLADRDERPDGTRVAMAHRRADVRAINDAIRTELQDRGELARGEDAGALTFQTNDGAGVRAGRPHRVLENNRDLGVKNGMLGTVEHVEAAGSSRSSTAGAAIASACRWATIRRSTTAMRRRFTKTRARRSIGLCDGVGDDGPASNLCRHDPAS